MTNQSHTSDNAAYHKVDNPQEQGFYGLIYISTNLKNGKIYIGQTIRMDEDYYIGSGLHFSRAVKKYGRKNFVSHLLQYATNKNELDRLEIEYIASFNSTNPAIGYNIAVGGLGGGSGENNPMYGRTGENNPNYGRTQSEEARRKISEAHKGKTLSESTKKKLSELNKGENSPRFKDKAHITDEVLFEYLQLCCNWKNEKPTEWGISCDKTLRKMFKNRYGTTSVKKVQKILAERLGFKVLNHENFINYCEAYLSEFLQKANEVFGITGEQLQRWAARTYKHAKTQTINGWKNHAKILESLKQNTKKRFASETPAQREQRLAAQREYDRQKRASLKTEKQTPNK